jgi:hypothetical protein
MEINHKRAGCKNIKKRKERKRERMVITEVEDNILHLLVCLISYLRKLEVKG